MTLRISLFIFLSFTVSCSGPRDSFSSQDSVNVIYETDSRTEIDSEQSTPQSSATALLVLSSKISMSADNAKLKTMPLGKTLPLCQDEQFLHQPTLGFCSGVLIATDKILTAAHCVGIKNDCAQISVIFNHTEAAARGGTISRDLVYNCKSIEKRDDRKTGGGYDYAVIRLDRPVKNITPVKISTSEPHAKDIVTSYSYPLGLPLKKDQGVILENNPTLNFFKAAVDTFEGSSGSPLFNSAGELLGILSTGSEDILEDDIYRIQTEGGCLNFRRCTSSDFCSERFLKVQRIPLN